MFAFIQKHVSDLTLTKVLDAAIAVCFASFTFRVPAFAEFSAGLPGLHVVAAAGVYFLVNVGILAMLIMLGVGMMAVVANKCPFIRHVSLQEAARIRNMAWRDLLPYFVKDLSVQIIVCFLVLQAVYEKVFLV
jgi:hypothetical protein